MNRLLDGHSATASMREELSYDKMGNMQTLKRDGGTTTNYVYTGNRLTSLSGGLSGSYSYDANGNALTDRSGFSYSYNQLNLPSTASKPGVSISYHYDANGNKRKSVGALGSGITQDYLPGGIEYKNGVLDRIATPTGYITFSGSTPVYQYYLSDHLGNVRVVFSAAGSSPTVIQQQDYYPFGLRKALAGSGVNAYLYNGKELQGELGQYDYGARFYDHVIGRWNVVDPLSEQMRRWSPYAYGFNNPIRFIDPDGRQPRRTDPPGWFRSAYNAWTRLATGTSGSSANNAIPNASPQTQSINRALGTASDVKDISAAAAPYAMEVSSYVGEGLETAGAATTMAGYVLAPVTQGASLGLLPVGSAIEGTGITLQLPKMVAEGKGSEAVYSVGSFLLFNEAGKLINRAESAGKITKTDNTILNFITDLWKETADRIFEYSGKNKKN